MTYISVNHLHQEAILTYSVSHKIDIINEYEAYDKFNNLFIRSKYANALPIVHFDYQEISITDSYSN